MAKTSDPKKIREAAKKRRQRSQPVAAVMPSPAPHLNMVEVEGGYILRPKFQDKVQHFSGVGLEIQRPMNTKPRVAQLEIVKPNAN